MHRLGTLRNRKKTLKAFTELDAFPKIPENYQETTASGGSVTLVISVFIFILVLSEFWYYRAIESKYSYEVDTDYDSKLLINVDLTVAMKCDDLGVDVLDLSGSTMDLEDGIKLEPAYFELTDEQKIWMTMFKDFYYFFEGYRSLGEMESFKSGMPTYMPKRKDSDNQEGKPHDACRVYGSFEVNKVAGNFHLTSGKSIQHPQGHAHLSALVPEQAVNFSHRIDRLSFGHHMPGYVNPLDGDMQTADKARMMYQYYIKIVPTKIKFLGSSQEVLTNQYSVTQKSREISHNRGSHGIPGIFFKYDMSSIMVHIKYQHRSMVAFLVRLCGIVGGIFATSGMLHSFIGFLVDVAMCRFGFKKEKEKLPSESTDAPVVQSNGPPSPTLNPGLPVSTDELQKVPEVTTITPTTPLLQNQANA
ncbi:endoplasmic reticulum-Golgi intermediate compartment protein 2-like [Actinia tenebrosa]|uniref:Endoplasmic reticulum-Golgi intermediate compartment protein 2-like n=1 Tax=Actinia tenebrosa TaxID=6105 RepID=A0A6P8HX81_ACTTE|nr:endoplasmic reticulum-Golgi intermediate compartment protein 2-like [Actinia tenebrosa]